MSVENLYNKESGEVINPNIVSENIPAGAITSSKIASGAVAGGNIIDGAITTAKVADEAITSAKLSNNAVSASKIQGSAVVGGKIADGAITEAKIDNGAVTRTKIASNAVNKGKMAVYTLNWLLYLNRPESTAEFLEAVFRDYVPELQSNTLIELNMYSYNGSVYSPVKIYYDITANEVFVYVLDDTGWTSYQITSATAWATAYTWIEDIYITYLL